jgi:hypothetical protein
MRPVSVALTILALLFVSAPLTSAGSHRVVIFDLAYIASPAGRAETQSTFATLAKTFADVQVSVDCGGTFGSLVVTRMQDDSPASFDETGVVCQGGPWFWSQTQTLHPGDYLVKGSAAGAGTMSVVVTGLRVK